LPKLVWLKIRKMGNKEFKGCKVSKDNWDKQDWQLRIKLVWEKSNKDFKVNKVGKDNGLQKKTVC